MIKNRQEASRYNDRRQVPMRTGCQAHRLEGSFPGGGQARLRETVLHRARAMSNTAANARVSGPTPSLLPAGGGEGGDPLADPLAVHLLHRHHLPARRRPRPALGRALRRGPRAGAFRPLRAAGQRPRRPAQVAAAGGRRFRGSCNRAQLCAPV